MASSTSLDEKSARLIEFPWGVARAVKAFSPDLKRASGQGQGEYENAHPPPGPPGIDKLSTCQVPKWPGKLYT